MIPGIFCRAGQHAWQRPRVYQRRRAAQFQDQVRREGACIDGVHHELDTDRCGWEFETFERRCEFNTPINLATSGWSCCRQQEFCDCSVRLVLGQFSSLCLKRAMYDAVTVLPIPGSGEQTFRLHFNARIEGWNRTASMSSCGNRLHGGCA